MNGVQRWTTQCLEPIRCLMTAVTSTFPNANRSLWKHHDSCFLQRWSWRLEYKTILHCVLLPYIYGHEGATVFLFCFSNLVWNILVIFFYLLVCQWRTQRAQAVLQRLFQFIIIWIHFKLHRMINFNNYFKIVSIIPIITTKLQGSQNYLSKVHIWYLL